MSLGRDAGPFQYTGREKDGTGLDYYRARYYQPGAKRFIPEDPIRQAGGLNAYSTFEMTGSLTLIRPANS